MVVVDCMVDSSCPMAAGSLRFLCGVRVGGGVV